MPSEMLERCARAAKDALLTDPETDAYMDRDDEPDFFLIDGHVNLYLVARAVLEALREPTVAMGMAAFDATRDMGDETPLAEEYLAVWQAMLDEALKPCA